MASRGPRRTSSRGNPCPAAPTVSRRSCCARTARRRRSRPASPCSTTTWTPGPPPHPPAVAVVRRRHHPRPLRVRRPAAADDAGRRSPGAPRADVRERRVQRGDVGWLREVRVEAGGQRPGPIVRLAEAGERDQDDRRSGSASPGCARRRCSRRSRACRCRAGRRRAGTTRSAASRCRRHRLCGRRRRSRRGGPAVGSILVVVDDTRRQPARSRLVSTRGRRKSPRSSGIVGTGTA